MADNSNVTQKQKNMLHNQLFFFLFLAPWFGFEVVVTDVDQITVHTAHSFKKNMNLIENTNIIISLSLLFILSKATTTDNLDGYTKL